jgi:hypothetical protein
MQNHASVSISGLPLSLSMVHIRDKISAVNGNNKTKIKITVCYNVMLYNMVDKFISTRLCSATSKNIITSVLTVVREPQISLTINLNMNMILSRFITWYTVDESAVNNY